MAPMLSDLDCLGKALHNALISGQASQIIHFSQDSLAVETVGFPPAARHDLDDEGC